MILDTKRDFKTSNNNYGKFEIQNDEQYKKLPRQELYN